MKIIGVGKNLITQSRGDAKDFTPAKAQSLTRIVRDESLRGNALVSLRLWSIS